MQYQSRWYIHTLYWKIMWFQNSQLIHCQWHLFAYNNVPACLSFPVMCIPSVIKLLVSDVLIVLKMSALLHWISQSPNEQYTLLSIALFVILFVYYLVVVCMYACMHNYYAMTAAAFSSCYEVPWARNYSHWNIPCCIIDRLSVGHGNANSSDYIVYPKYIALFSCILAKYLVFILN